MKALYPSLNRFIFTDFSFILFLFFLFVDKNHPKTESLKSNNHNNKVLPQNSTLSIDTMIIKSTTMPSLTTPMLVKSSDNTEISFSKHDNQMTDIVSNNDTNGINRIINNDRSSVKSRWSMPFTFLHDFTDCCQTLNVSNECIHFCSLHILFNRTNNYFDAIRSCTDDFVNIVHCSTGGRNHVRCCQMENIPEMCQVSDK